MTDDYFEQKILDAVSRGNDQAIKDVVGEFATFCGKEPQDWEMFPERTMDFLARLLVQESVLKMEGTHMLFCLFQFEWSRLTDSQRAKLLVVLSTAYRKNIASISRFVICELLGDYYANAEAIRILKEFVNMNSEEGRVFIPHAFEHLMDATNDSAIRTDVSECLHSLARDRSPRVRLEAEAAIGRLKLRML